MVKPNRLTALLRRRVAYLTVAALAASGFVLAVGEPAATASICTPFPRCFGTPFQVSGTPDNSLTEWTDSPLNGGKPAGSEPNGATLWVDCQANNGPQEDGKFNAPAVPSRTWDFAYDPATGQFVVVYDWWMNTPPQRAAFNWYSWSNGAPNPADSPCNFVP